MQTELRALLITMIILPTVIILIRAWSRALLPVDPTARIASRFWWDDWTAFIAAVHLYVIQSTDYRNYYLLKNLS